MVAISSTGSFDRRAPAHRSASGRLLVPGAAVVCLDEGYRVRHGTVESLGDDGAARIVTRQGERLVVSPEIDHDRACFRHPRIELTADG